MEWLSQGVPLPIGRRRERLLLGLLLLDIGRVVPAHRLIDLLWDEEAPPSSARGSLQVHVSRLRGRFTAAHAEQHGFALSRGNDGYLVDGDPESVDLHRVRQLWQRAEREQDISERLRLLNLALDDWGGPVLAGTASDGLVRRLGTGFDALYLSAVTQRAEARLALGHRGLLLEELARATAEYPHHERLAMLRMIALYRADHRGEALEVYNETRARLAGDLGLDPGTDLNRVQGMILRADPELLDGPILPDPARAGQQGYTLARTAPGLPVPAHHARTAGEVDTEGGQQARGRNPRRVSDDASASTAAAGGETHHAKAHPTETEGSHRPETSHSDVHGSATNRPYGSSATTPVPARPVAESVQQRSRTGAFIGRALELERLTRLAMGARGGSGVVMIVGSAGSGKTALALQWCRGSTDAFPDGQIFLNLRGHGDESPMTHKEALSGLLRALGVSYQQLPHDVPALAELYQRTLTGRRVLIVLDNAETASQVKQLLPYEAGCLALVTSRNRLGGLIVSHGAPMLPLSPLALDEAEELVRSVIGTARAAAEPEALADLVALCDRTPLALRIAAANLALRPDGRIADHVAEMRSGNPLESLAVVGDPDSAVRRAFEHSYRRLDKQAKEAFRVLGLLPCPATTVAAVAALLDRPVNVAHCVIDRLFAEHLVERGSQDRIRLHDLIWWYARLLADAQEPAPAHREARRRLLRWYTASADAAARSLYPQILRLDIEPVDAEARPESFPDPQTAADWFDAEQAGLVRLIEREAAGEPHPAVWVLADTLRGYFWLRRDAETWTAVATAALRAAQQAGDLRGQAAAQQSLGLVTFTLGGLELSRTHFEQAIELARRSGWSECESVALSNLAGVSADLGHLSHAAEFYAQSIGIDRGLRRTPHQPLQGLSEVLYGMGRLAEAERLCRRALVLSQQIAAPDSIARISTTLAMISLDLGELEAAETLARESLQGFQAIGNLSGEGDAFSALALVAAEGGDELGALRYGLAAYRLSRRSGRPRIKLDAMLALGHARYQRREYSRAFEHFRVARKTAEEMGYLKGRTMALLGLGACAVRAQRPHEGLGYAAGALALAQASQLRLLEGQAQSVIALAQSASGHPSAAGRAREQAEGIYRVSGYRPVRSPYGEAVGSCPAAPDAGGRA
ncbi:AfsR/SARP family transcriptional regulator [Streptomyces albipurpureus]|uniref:Tetratricopeptide repeat protein n=1 Tax=Streptomyces albipurpureus TaxID=2897419 RepID=A0ABT0UGG5_9ACTN|nr:BTAD domain-containing putative transcriptional regulator [Streptomyces sp. CWNU-1]MCM2387114.1 tetratricopeptide repeat protein [Streptomyces sp. CWNU-1]